jgi:hypothetical protein
VYEVTAGGGGASTLLELRPCSQGWPMSAKTKEMLYPPLAAHALKKGETRPSFKENCSPSSPPRAYQAIIVKVRSANCCRDIPRNSEPGGNSMRRGTLEPAPNVLVLSAHQTSE